jgi:hypothetical protein
LEGAQVKTFKSLGDLSLFLSKAVAQKEVLHKGLERIGEKIEQTAKEEIGTYQDAIGPFLEWEQLADSTERAKARKGYPADAPLLGDGELRDSYSHEMDGWDAVVIGSPHKEALFHEVGTVRMPPREVLGPAVERNRKEIEREMGDALLETLLLDTRRQH